MYVYVLDPQIGAFLAVFTLLSINTLFCLSSNSCPLPMFGDYKLIITIA